MFSQVTRPICAHFVALVTLCVTRKVFRYHSALEVERVGVLLSERMVGQRKVSSL